MHGASLRFAGKIGKLRRSEGRRTGTDQARNPATLEVCALLLKEGQQRQDPGLRYIGFRIPADFVVGYGLDVAERYRNLRCVRVYGGSQ